MAKNTKKETTPVVVPTVEPVPEVKKKGKAAKAKEPPVEVAPVVTPVEVVPVEQEPTPAPVDTVDNTLTSLAEKVSAAQGLLREVVSLLKVHQKAYAKIKKVALRAELKRSTARKGGLTKAINISEELATFLGLPKDVEISRTDVTKRLSVYFTENNLKNPENKREIFPNEALAKLLNIKDKGVKLSYFNLQTYIKHHFPAKPKVVEA